MNWKNSPRMHVVGTNVLQSKNTWVIFVAWWVFGGGGVAMWRCVFFCFALLCFALDNLSFVHLEWSTHTQKDWFVFLSFWFSFSLGICYRIRWCGSCVFGLSPPFLRSKQLVSNSVEELCLCAEAITDMAALEYDISSHRKRCLGVWEDRLLRSVLV